MDIKTYMIKINNQVNENFKKGLDVEQYKIAEIIQLIACYKKRGESLSNQKNLVEEVAYDLFNSVYLALSGLYRHSFISIRCSLELGVSLLKFYDDNYSYLLWKNNQEDISWSNLYDYEKGILSSKYLGLFIEGDFKVLIESIKNYYRECSEYVHGKYKYIKGLDEYRISYDEAICVQTLDMCKKVAKALNILICIRFGNETDEYYSLIEDCIKLYEVKI